MTWFSCGVMFKALDCGTVVNKIELLSRYYGHFRKIPWGRVMNPLILFAIGKIALLVFIRRVDLALNNL